MRIPLLTDAERIFLNAQGISRAGFIEIRIFYKKTGIILMNRKA
jgi:hypothetical protein